VSGLDELLHSPLDDDHRGARGRFAAPLAAAVAAFAVYAAMTAIFGSGGDEAETPGATTTTTIPEQTIVEVSDPFPEHFVEIGGDIAVMAHPAVDAGDRVLVPLSMAVRRGVAADAVEQPIGGEWEMETAAGPVRSVGVVTDSHLPGALSVEFPAGTVPAPQIRLVELWETRTVSVSASIEFPGVPYTAEGAIVNDLGGGITLTIDRLELGNLLAEAEWSVAGSDRVIADIGIDLLTANGTTLGSYVAVLPDITPAASGLIRYTWPFGIRVDQNDASTLVVRVAARLVTPVPGDAVIPLP
jgi:hypothetical protein